MIDLLLVACAFVVGVIVGAGGCWRVVMRAFDEYEREHGL